jgi:hypothetical protein
MSLGSEYGRWQRRVTELFAGSGQSPIERAEWQLRLLTYPAFFRAVAIIGWFADAPSVARGLRSLSVLVGVVFVFALWRTADRFAQRAARVGAFSWDPAGVGSHLPQVTIRSWFVGLYPVNGLHRLAVLVHVLTLPHHARDRDITSIVLWAIAWIYILVSLWRDGSALRTIVHLGPARVRAWRLMVPPTLNHLGSATAISLELRCMQGLALEYANLVCLAYDTQNRLDPKNPRWVSAATKFAAQHDGEDAPLGGYVTLSRAQIDDVDRRPNTVFYLDCVLVERVAPGAPASVQPERARYLVPIEW